MCWGWSVWCGTVELIFRSTFRSQQVNIVPCLNVSVIQFSIVLPSFCVSLSGSLSVPSLKGHLLRRITGRPGLISSWWSWHSDHVGKYGTGTESQPPARLTRYEKRWSSSHTTDFILSNSKRAEQNQRNTGELLFKVTQGVRWIVYFQLCLQTNIKLTRILILLFLYLYARLIFAREWIYSG